MFKHEDERRILYEWASGDFKTAKALIVTALNGCVVGDHYHRNKDEHFFLLKGMATRVVIGCVEHIYVSAPAEFHVPAGTYHLFDLVHDSILLGTATAEFDRADEIKGRP